MKVGIIYFQYPLYKSGSYIQEQVDAIAGQTEQVVLVATNFPKGTDFPKPKNLKIVWVPRWQVPVLSNLLFNLSVFWLALRSREFRQTDVINVVCARGILASSFLSFILRKPLVCTIEIISNPNTSFMDRLVNFSQRLLYTRRFDKIICWSKHYHQKYLKQWGIPAGRVTIIPGGINIQRYNPTIDGSEIRRQFPRESLLIVFAKPMYEYNRKMAEFLLQVVNRLRSEIDIRLLLGDGEQRDRLEERIREYNLEEKASFMPVVPITEIPKYIAASDLVVLPFTYEATTSRSLLESLALGKSVITTRSGEVSQVVRDNHDALLVDLDVEKVAEAIRRLHHNKQLAKELSTNARKLIEQKYAIDVIAKQTIMVYRSVLGDKKE